MAGAIDKTLEHAMFIARHLNHCDYSTVITLVLYELGLSPKNDGFTYLKKAIGFRYENSTRHLKNDIYSELSARFDGLEENNRIEQAMRRSIVDAWKERDDEIWGLLFPKTRNGVVKRPSNGDFIARVAWFVELWEGCCKEVLYAKR